MVPLVSATWSILFIVEDAGAWLASTRGRPESRLSAEGLGLSLRETEVAELLLEGKGYHEIGRALFISKATVKTHVGRIYRKLGVRSKMGLVHRLMA